MQVEIVYCEACGYRRMAERMAEALRVAYGVGVALVPGSDGAFEVMVDRGVIFSKQTLDRFPTERELVSLLGERWRAYSSSASSSASSAAVS